MIAKYASPRSIEYDGNMISKKVQHIFSKNCLKKIFFFNIYFVNVENVEKHRS